MPAISAVFTIALVTVLLGEGEEWLHEVSIDMEPEDGACGSMVSASMVCLASPSTVSSG